MNVATRFPAEVPAHVPPGLVFDFDIYADPRVTGDVQASYARALQGAPDIFYTPRNGGHWMARRQAQISEILKDHEHFSVRELQIPRVPNPPFLIPLSLDPPANLPYRVAMMPKFSPAAIRALEPRIRDWAERIVGEVAGHGRCDFIADVSSLFPVSVFMELIGLPLPRLRAFREIAQAFFSARDAAAFEAVSEQILGLFTGLIALRREQPGDDLISHFLNVEVEGRRLRDEEILAMGYVLFIGGMDTVTNLTGFLFRHLAGDGALQARLAADPGLIPKFVDEGLRCFGVANPPRLVVKDCDRFGAPFRAGDMVLNLLMVGGRDDRVNADPDRFDIDRPGAAHITFSTGPHLCIGHILARTEIRILAETWLKHIPAFSAEPGVRHGFRIGPVIAIERLPLAW